MGGEVVTEVSSGSLFKTSTDGAGITSREDCSHPYQADPTVTSLKVMEMGAVRVLQVD